MKNKKFEIAIYFMCSLICFGASCFVYFIYYKIEDDLLGFPNRLEWLVDNFGKTFTSILFSLPGFFLDI